MFDYDAGRRVTVYVPPDPPEAIVFAGDGQMIAQWGVMLEGADVPPTMIVDARNVFRRGRRCVGTLPFRCRTSGRPHGRLWCFGRR